MSLFFVPEIQGRGQKYLLNSKYIFFSLEIIKNNLIFQTVNYNNYYLVSHGHFHFCFGFLNSINLKMIFLKMAKIMIDRAKIFTCTKLLFFIQNKILMRQSEKDYCALTLLII